MLATSAGGGTSAVVPFYAGLMARINANLGHPVGHLDSTLYTLPATTFRDIVGAPGPANNSFGRMKGYNADRGWDPDFQKPAKDLV